MMTILIETLLKGKNEKTLDYDKLRYSIMLESNFHKKYSRDDLLEFYFNFNLTFIVKSGSYSIYEYSSKEQIYDKYPYYSNHTSPSNWITILFQDKE